MDLRDFNSLNSDHKIKNYIHLRYFMQKNTFSTVWHNTFELSHVGSGWGGRCFNLGILLNIPMADLFLCWGVIKHSLSFE